MNQSPVDLQSVSASNPEVAGRWLYVAAGGLTLTGLFLAIAGLLAGYEHITTIGAIVLLTGFLAALPLRSLCHYRFTLCIFIASLAAMLAPNCFRSIGGYSLTDPWLLLVLIQVIMFGMGTQMSARDFLHVAKMPGAVLTGVCCQFVYMPLLGYVLARVFNFSPEIGAGLILVGSCSSGVASNVMTYLAKGNLALSVTLTAIITALAPIATPLWMRLLAGSMVDINAVNMALDIVRIVLAPILAAFVHDLLRTSSTRIRKAVCVGFVLSLVWLAWCLLDNAFLIAITRPESGEHRDILTLLLFYVAISVVFGFIYHVVQGLLPAIDDWMPRISMIGIVYFTLVATAQGRDQLLEVGFMLLIAVLLHNTLGLTLGYWTSRAFRLDKKDAQTIAIVVGSQNAAMAAGLARNMGTLGAAGLAAVIFAPVMNITGSLIANYWRRQQTEH